MNFAPFTCVDRFLLSQMTKITQSSGRRMIVAKVAVANRIYEVSGVMTGRIPPPSSVRHRST